MKRLENKVAIVTGAGRGLGKGIALKLAEEGAKVVVADMAPSDNAVKEIEQAGGEAASFCVNVAKQEEVKALVEFAVEKYGTLWSTMQELTEMECFIRCLQKTGRQLLMWILREHFMAHRKQSNI